MTDNSARLLELARQTASEQESRHIKSPQSPVVAEVLGRSLAAVLKAAEPETAVVWDQIENAVLGHVVARDLGIDLVYAFSVEGSLGFSSSLEKGSRVVVISHDWTELHGLEALVRFIQAQGAVVTGIGSVLGAPGPELGHGIDTYTLDAKTESGETSKGPNS